MQTEKKKETARVIKFVLFSASAGIIETLAMILCEEILKIPAHWLCYGTALVLCVLLFLSFIRELTFQRAAIVPRAMLLVFLFSVPSAPFTVWNEHFLADTHGWNEYAVLAINMALNLSLEYLWDNFVVYRNSKDTNDIAKKKQGKEQQHE